MVYKTDVRSLNYDNVNKVCSHVMHEQIEKLTMKVRLALKIYIKIGKKARFCPIFYQNIKK